MRIGHFFIYMHNIFHRSRTIDENKQLWETLSKNGIGISNKPRTSKEMHQWGWEDYQNEVLNDPLFEKGDVMLDLGCGNGRMTRFFFNDFKIVYGTDIAAEFIRQAKECVPEGTFFETDGQDIPLPDNCLDFVFSHAVFQYIPTKEMISGNLRETYRTLKSKGRAKLQFRGTPVRKNKWFYGYSFRERELKELLKCIGFTILRLDADRQRVGGKTHYWAYVEK